MVFLSGSDEIVPELDDVGAGVLGRVDAEARLSHGGQTPEWLQAEVEGHGHQDQGGSEEVERCDERPTCPEAHHLVDRDQAASRRMLAPAHSQEPRRFPRSSIRLSITFRRSSPRALYNVAGN